jgi:hypothetical protein
MATTQFAINGEFLRSLDLKEQGSLEDGNMGEAVYTQLGSSVPTLRSLGISVYGNGEYLYATVTLACAEHEVAYGHVLTAFSEALSAIDAPVTGVNVV